MGVKLPPSLFRNAAEPVDTAYTERMRKCSWKRHNGPQVSKGSNPVTRQTAFKTCHLISVQLWQWSSQSAALWSFSCGLLCPWCALHVELDITLSSTGDTSRGTASSAPRGEAGGGCSWGRAHLAPWSRHRSGGRDQLNTAALLAREEGSCAGRKSEMGLQ